ncbi:MAG: alpha/beta hydrolase [Desulfobacteraceae bacterium]|nr:MAG: alpha/beta hydrolase [Desulfobacteraceae bacterium]
MNPFPSKSTRFRHRLFSGAFEALSHTGSFSPVLRAASRRCDIIKNISYAPDGKPAHRLDVFRPARQGSLRPVIMYIHGGGFTMCSKDTHRGIGQLYAANGYVVFTINYRLAPKYRYPAAIEDVALAYQWIVANAKTYGGDPERIIVAGESAGGNLTLMLGIAACFKRQEPAAQMIWETGAVPKVLLVLCGMLQVSDPDHLIPVCPRINPFSRKLDQQIARDVSRAYLGRDYKNPLPEQHLADPLLIMESGATPDRPFPLTYAMAGTHDILLNHTQRLEAALTKKNIRNVAQYFPKQGHAFHLLGLSPQAGIFWREHLNFLRREIQG